MSDHRRKITAGQVLDIRAQHANGATLKDLGKKYHITLAYVWKLVHGLSHKTDTLLVCPHCHTPISKF